MVGLSFCPSISKVTRHVGRVPSAILVTEKSKDLIEQDRIIKMQLEVDIRAVNWDSRVQGLAGPAWTRESESNFNGLARLAWRSSRGACEQIWSS